MASAESTKSCLRQRTKNEVYRKQILKPMLPKRLSRTVIYESDWINLYTDRVQYPSGMIIEKFHFLDYQKISNVILLLNERDEICMVQVKRYVTQLIAWELPAGNIEPGEDHIESGERELKEETGFETKLRKVYDFYACNGMSNHSLNILYGKIEMPKVQPKHSDEDEINMVKWFSQDEIKEMIKKGEMKDGISLLPLSMYFSGLLNISEI